MSEHITQLLQDALATQSLIVYLFIFISGVLASLSPCTYPMLPLIIGYIGNTANKTRSRGIVLTFFIVLSMATIYAIIGMVFVSFGSVFNSFWFQGWVLFTLAWTLIIVSLFLLEVFSLPTSISSLHSFLQSRFTNAFLISIVASLLMGPCVTPLLAIVLANVALTIKNTTGIDTILQILNGGIKLFLFGLGQGTLILLCGSFTGFLAYLPKPGKWSSIIQKAFAFLIIAEACLIFIYIGQSTYFPKIIHLLYGSP